MIGRQLLSNASRNRAFVIMAGAGGFAVGLGIFLVCGTGWMVEALTETSALVAGFVLALPFGLGAAALGALFINGRRRRQARLLRTALNNMTQGLCMFDGAARLVLCNERYAEMYQLRPRDAPPGTPPPALLRQRVLGG